MRATPFLIPALVAFVLAGPASAAEDASLGNGMIRFAPPPGPWVVQSVADHGTSVFYRIEEEATLLIAFVGNKAPKTPEVAEFTKGGIHDRIVTQFRQKQFDMIVEPTVVKDERFFLVIHEQFRKDASVHSQWHIYRNLPPHQFVATLLVAGEDKDRLDLLRRHAEEAILSGALVPKGTKAPPPPVAPKAGGVDSAAVEAAKRAVDAATADALAALERKPAYQAAVTRMRQAEAKLAEERARSPRDPDAVAAASKAWIEAKGPVETMKKEALDADPAVNDAKQKLAGARNKR